MKSEIQDHALEQYSEETALELEDSLWWFQGRKSIIRNYLELARQRMSLDTIMDVGCGSGGSLEVLAEYGSVIGVERSPVLAERARSRKIAVEVMEVDVANMREGLDVRLFTFFDVLEHIEDDSSVLKQLKRSASQKHLLLVSVPACPFLYGRHDKILHHYRRYSRDMLKRCLTDGGYRVLHMSYFMFLLFPLALLDRLRDQVSSVLGKERETVNLGIVPPLLNKILVGALRLEALLGKYVSFPIGLWLFALAEKQD
jgi:SAM-dependent methyltransferase